MKKIIPTILSKLRALRLRLRFAYCQWKAAQIIRRTKAKYPNSDGIFATDVWPPTAGVTTGFQVKGKTTILWGTDGALSSPYPPGGGFYTVLRVTQKPLLERSKLTNGSGVTSSDVFVFDGVTSEFTVRDESTMTPPALNTTVTIVDMAGLLGGRGTTYTARVVDTNYDGAVKQPGERILMLDNLLLIDSQVYGSQTAR